MLGRAKKGQDNRGGSRVWGPPCPVKCQAGLGAIALEALGVRTRMQRVLEKNREPRDRATTRVWSLFCDCYCLCVYPEYFKKKCWHTAYKRTTGYWEGLGDVRVIIQQHCAQPAQFTRGKGAPLAVLGSRQARESQVNDARVQEPQLEVGGSCG